MLALALAPAARAHDFWIRPRSWTPELNSVVPLELEVGDRFTGEAVAREAAFVRTFEFFCGDLKGPVVGFEGRTPAGLLRPAQAGVVVIAYESNPRAIELTPEKFGQYLLEEGLENIVALREARGEAGLPAKERFVRCAKALLRAGGSHTDGWDREVGLTLELVPRSDPFGAQPLRVELLFRGKPLAGALVEWMSRDCAPGGGAAEVAVDVAPQDWVVRRARTDEQGLVEMPLGAGTWLVSVTHMTALPRAAAPDPTSTDPSEWESHWASLTFQRPAAPDRAGDSPNAPR